MQILSFEKPEKTMERKEYERNYASSAQAIGTYVPNMSDKDRQKWRAKKVGGKDPRVEIRKTVSGTDPSLKYPYTSSQLLAIVRPTGVILSANGRLAFDNKTFVEFQYAVAEALGLLEK